MSTATATIRTRSVKETEALGERLGAALAGGEFVGLAGELGAGKTALVRGITRGAGVPPDAQVSSPTFAIVNAYRGGRLPIFHADLYRVRDAEELYDSGFYDLFETGGALVVEWIDRVPEFAPEDWLEIRIEKQPRGRVFAMTAHGPRAEKLLAVVVAGASSRSSRSREE